LKTLATTGAIVLTGVLDHILLGGPLTPSMVIAGLQVIIAICNYSFDATTAATTTTPQLQTVESATNTSSAPRSKAQSSTTNIHSTREGVVIAAAPKSDEMEKLLRRPSYDVELAPRSNDH
jgi:hypothetical protein